MSKKQFILAVIFSLMLPVVCRAQNLLSDSITNELRKGVVGFKDRYHSPGIVVVIVHDQNIIFSEAQGYIDLESKTPATVDSKYPVLSVTKTFTATMFMQLAERNLISFDDDVKKYVPEYEGKPYLDEKKRTTLFQLATHTSGLPRNSPADINFTKQVDKWLLGGINYATIEPAPKKEFLQSLKFIQREYPEYELLSYGDRHYSNLGYSLLGIALERAAKTTYTEYLLNYICKPLNMKNTGFDTETSVRGSLAKGYYYNDSLKNFIKTPVFISNSALYAGGMYSTATDLAKFISFQFDNSAEANKILLKENRTMMQALKIGWKPSYPFVLHEGAMLGYRCQLIFNPELKIGWVILTNTTDFEFSRMNEYISRLVSPVYSKKSITDLNKYTGTYRLAGGYDSLRIEKRGDSLYSTYLGDVLRGVALIPLGNNRFKGQGKGNYSIGYEFIPNDEGEIKILNMGQLMWVKQ